MRILLWHVHGSWTTAFVQGPHTCLLPVTPDRGPDGLGRAATFDWPERVVEVPPEELEDAEVDLVLLQRPYEAALAERWLGGRRPGRDVPAVYVEHNTPQADVPHTPHPAAELPGVVLVHVTHFNSLLWDAGSAPTAVIEHGVVDPGPLYTGELERAAVVVNDPIARGRTVGTDLLPRFAETAPLDVFGMRTGGLAAHLGLDPGRVHARDLPQRDLHRAMAARRAYLHPVRWTSLGLSLLEAMHMGMPVVALDTTEVSRAVPEGAGVVSNRLEVLTDAVRDFLADPAHARAVGERARAAALARYGLPRFLDDWERLIKEVSR
jgi:glycosyltransferase involved in cell wall biosynthesis